MFLLWHGVVKSYGGTSPRFYANVSPRDMIKYDLDNISNMLAYNDGALHAYMFFDKYSSVYIFLLWFCFTCCYCFFFVISVTIMCPKLAQKLIIARGLMVATWRGPVGPRGQIDHLLLGRTAIWDVGQTTLWERIWGHHLLLICDLENCPASTYLGV